MILVTGANGQTGRAIIRALSSKGEEVRAFVHKAEHIQKLKSLGVKEVVAGDMLDQGAMNEAFKGIRAAYHICSAVNPDEVRIGQIAINAAALSARIEHFVYHSVLHSGLTFCHSLEGKFGEHPYAIPFHHRSGNQLTD